MGVGDQFRKSRWKSWPLGQDPDLPLDMDLAIRLQADCEVQMVALDDALERISVANSPREQVSHLLTYQSPACFTEDRRASRSARPWVAI